MIRGLLFDKDGTLLDFDANWRELVNEVLDELAPDDPALRRVLADVAGMDPDSGRFRPGSVSSDDSFFFLPRFLLERPSFGFSSSGHPSFFTTFTRSTGRMNSLGGFFLPSFVACITRVMAMAIN